MSLDNRLSHSRAADDARQAQWAVGDQRSDQSRTIGHRPESLATRPVHQTGPGLRNPSASRFLCCRWLCVALQREDPRHLRAMWRAFSGIDARL